MSNQVKGYTLGAIAAATYGMNPLFALPLYGIGMEADSVLLFRYLFGIIALAAMLKLRGHSFAINRRDVLPLAALGLLFSLSSLTLFESYNYMDAGIASTILFVYPLMVAGIMACFFGERITLLTTGCLVAALGGIALLYNGDGGATLSLTGTALVLGSALSYAIYIVGVNRSRLNTMPTLKITFYVLLFGSLLFVGRTAYRGVQVPPAEQWYMWGCLLALGLLPTAVSLICTTAAIQYVGSTPTAILGALEPATAVLFGVTIFGEVLTPRLALGLLLIIGAVTLMVAAPGLPRLLLRLRKMFPRLRQ